MNVRELACPGMSSACVLVVREGGLVLATWNERHSCFGLPGGKREATDASIRDTARRELLEETGLMEAELTWLYAGQYQALPKSDVPPREVHLYHARSVDGRAEPKETTIVWMQWDWLLKVATAFRSFYEEGLPDGIAHLKVTR